MVAVGKTERKTRRKRDRGKETWGIRRHTARKSKGEGTDGKRQTARKQ